MFSPCISCIMQGCDIAFGSIVERHAEMVRGNMTLDAYTPLQEKVRLVYFATVMVLKLAKSYGARAVARPCSDLVAIFVPA